MNTNTTNQNVKKDLPPIKERLINAWNEFASKKDSNNPDTQIQDSIKNGDNHSQIKPVSQETNPPEALKPEDAEYVRELEGKKKKIEKVKEISKISIEASKEQKKAKIAKASAKTLGFFETLVTAKNAYFKYLEKHHIFMFIGTISLIGSIVLHELANVTILNKIFPSLSNLLKHGIATSVSILFEALAITLVMTRFKIASYCLDAVIIGMISWSSYYEFSVNQLDPISSLSRGVIGVSFFIGLMIITHVIASAESERKRQRFEHLPKKRRRELLASLTKLKADILKTEKRSTEKKEKRKGDNVTIVDVEVSTYDDKIRYNWLATCSAYNIKSGSLKKVAVRLGIFSKIFFAQIPKEKRAKKKVKGYYTPEKIDNVSNNKIIKEKSKRQERVYAYEKAEKEEKQKAKQEATNNQ